MNDLRQRSYTENGQSFPFMKLKKIIPLLSLSVCVDHSGMKSRSYLAAPLERGWFDTKHTVKQGAKPDWSGAVR